MDSSSPQLEFPLTWHGKIIAQDSDDLDDRVRTALLGLGLEHPVRRGNVSQAGRYVTLNVSVEFTDREMMVRVTETLAAVSGVRMVI
jgi:putative lipoic acid-binding regulatory protein